MFNRSLVDLDFQGLIEVAPATIAVLDRDRRCSYAYPALDRAFGRPLAGKPT